MNFEFDFDGLGKLESFINTRDMVYKFLFGINIGLLVFFFGIFVFGWFFYKAPDSLNDGKLVMFQTAYLLVFSFICLKLTNRAFNTGKRVNYFLALFLTIIYPPFITNLIGATYDFFNKEKLNDAISRGMI